jgi:biopolymer transport protein TolQ
MRGEGGAPPGSVAVLRAAGVAQKASQMLELILGASPLVKGVVALLISGSLFSWAIILFKLNELRAAEADSEAFVEAYQQRPMHAVYDVARQCDRSPLAHLFSRGYVEVAQLERMRGGSSRPTPELIESVCKRLAWELLAQTQRAERGLSFLATTGSTAPFVGLFGTVVGIMNSFQQIGMSGSASLAVVGPGIAEALFATALGLAAAIPAVIAFNYLSARIARLTGRLETFRADFEQELRRTVTTAA